MSNVIQSSDCWVGMSISSCTGFSTLVIDSRCGLLHWFSASISFVDIFMVYRTGKNLRFFTVGV